jgi:hypothetical protein
MNVGGDVRWVIKRASTDEPHFWPGVLAEDRDLTARATKDPLNAAVVAGNIDRLGRSGENLNTLCLNQQIDDEGAARLTLTVQTMAAMNEQGLRE